MIIFVKLGLTFAVLTIVVGALNALGKKYVGHNQWLQDLYEFLILLTLGTGVLTIISVIWGF